VDEERIEPVEIESPYPRPLMRVADAGFCWPQHVIRRNAWTLFGIAALIIGFKTVAEWICCAVVVGPLIWWLVRWIIPPRQTDDIYGPMWREQGAFSQVAIAFGFGIRDLLKASTGRESTYTTPIIDGSRIVFAAGLADQLTTEEIKAMALYACVSHRTPAMPIFLAFVGFFLSWIALAFSLPFVISVAPPVFLVMCFVVPTTLIFWLFHARALSVVRRAGLEPALQSAFEFRRDICRKIPWYARSPLDTLRRFGFKIF
jgi:hypothetical protein